MKEKRDLRGLTELLNETYYISLVKGATKLVTLMELLMLLKRTSVQATRIYSILSTGQPRLLKNRLGFTPINN